MSILITWYSFANQMLKTLLKYLLSFCILLLGGYSLFSAQIDKGDAFYTPIQVLEGTASANLNSGTAHQDQTYISSPSSSGTKKATDTIDAAENEVKEEELGSSRRNLASENYLTAVFYTLALGCFFRYLKASLHFVKHFSYHSSSKRYLILRVLRI